MPLSPPQRRGTRKRLKLARGLSTRGPSTERGVAIPQITYDHIQETEDKKDMSFFLEESAGTVEGTGLQQHLLWFTLTNHRSRAPPPACSSPPAAEITSPQSSTTLTGSQFNLGFI
jgi:hypothetical protein